MTLAYEKEGHIVKVGLNRPRGKKCTRHRYPDGTPQGMAGDQ
jgi:hypothetical protein